MRQVGDWWLPDDDAYFAPHVEQTGGFDCDRLARALFHVKHWRTAVDVGAHVGFHARTLCGRFGHVVCLEPQHGAYLCLKSNLEPFQNVTTMRVAAGQEAGRAELRNDAKRPGNTGARWVEFGIGMTNVVALDDLGLSEVDFLKIDVEGAEHLVIGGARGLIRAWAPVIMVEIKKSFGARYGVADGCAAGLLRDLGYRRVDKVGSDWIMTKE